MVSDSLTRQVVILTNVCACMALRQQVATLAELQLGPRVGPRVAIVIIPRAAGDNSGEGSVPIPAKLGISHLSAGPKPPACMCTWGRQNNGHQKLCTVLHLNLSPGTSKLAERLHQAHICCSQGSTREHTRRHARHRRQAPRDPNCSLSCPSAALPVLILCSPNTQHHTADACRCCILSAPCFPSACDPACSTCTSLAHA